MSKKKNASLINKGKKTPKFDLVHATEAQLNEARLEIKQLQDMLTKSDEHVKKKISDPESIMQEIQKKKKFIQDFAPKKLTGQAASKAYAEAKELKKKIIDAMPTQKMYYQRQARNSDRHSKAVDFDRTVEQQMRFQTDPVIQHAITRYKHLMRRIDPEDPTIANIELLRPRR